MEYEYEYENVGAKCYKLNAQVCKQTFDDELHMALSLLKFNHLFIRIIYTRV